MVDGEPANGNPNRLYRTLGDQKMWNAETGVTGTLGDWSWDVYFNHGDSELTVTNPNNTDNAKYLASLDAVWDAGVIRCWVSTQPAFASLYPGCIPTNITNPNGPSAASYDYLRTKTSWTLSQKLDDVGFSFGGGLGFGLPAGDIVANVSGEARWATYTMQSDFSPLEFVNCTGLRFCLANGGAPLRWVQNTNAEVDVKNHIYEGALEFNVPLLKDVPGFKDVSANLAGRWTKYSTFDDPAKTWKLGLNWQVVDSVRLRSTLSSDIRAPNLNELYKPASITSSSFSDRLTGGNNQGQRVSTQGNPLLTPEEARTFTGGIVFTPEFISRFSLAVDFYETRLTNAIVDIDYRDDRYQRICTGSAPNYDSPFCQLAVRPITDVHDVNYTNPNFNMPTEVRIAGVNAAVQKLKGYDAQLDYDWDMFGGQFSLRHLASYQPTNSTLSTPVSFYTWAVQPHLMQTTFLNYHNESWNVALQNRWLSSVSVKSSDNKVNGNTQNYVDSNLPAYDIVDLTVAKTFEFGESQVEGFLTVNNLLDQRAPLFPSGSGLPGLFYPTLGFYDDTGRFYTLGFRAKF